MYFSDVALSIFSFICLQICLVSNDWPNIPEPAGRQEQSAGSALCLPCELICLNTKERIGCASTLSRTQPRLPYAGICFYGCALFVPDCGAGVGRVAKELLLHVFQEVDLLEPSQHLLEAAGVCLITGHPELRLHAP